MESQEITDFLKAVQAGIKSGSSDEFRLVSNVEIELAVIVNKEGGGKVNLAIVGGEGKYEKESVSKIKFSMGNNFTIYDQSRTRKQ